MDSDPKSRCFQGIVFCVSSEVGRLLGLSVDFCFMCCCRLFCIGVEFSDRCDAWSYFCFGGFESSKPSGIERDSMDHRGGHTWFFKTCILNACHFVGSTLNMHVCGQQIEQRTTTTQRRATYDDVRNDNDDDDDDDNGTNVARVAEQSPAQSPMPVSD